MRKQTPIAEGPTGPILLSDLAKGAQLPVLVALVRAGGLPLSNKDLAEETGVRDNERLAEALFQLARRNLIVNMGRPANKNEWVATAVARQFFLSAGQAQLEDPTPAAIESPALRLSRPETAEKPHTLGDCGKTALSGKSHTEDDSLPGTAEKPHSQETQIVVSRVDSRESGNTALSSPETESVKIQVESFNSVLVSQLLQITQSAAEAFPKQLEACYHEALLRGRVYRQLIPPLARTLAAEGLDYLPHLLAHIAYSRSQQFLADGQQRPGAYVKLAVQERALGDPNFMPPAGLSFEHALAWALRGGHFETDMPDDQAPEPEPEIDPSLAEPIQTNAGQQAPLAVWQAALSRLQLELNKSVFDTWVRPAVLLGYESDPETFRLGVPHIYAKEWLELRLMHQIKSALSDIVGRQTEVTVKVNPAVDSTSGRKPV